MSMRHSTDYLRHTKILIGVIAVVVITAPLFAPTVVAQTGNSTFDIEISDAPDEASVGENITVEATIESNRTETTDNNDTEQDTNSNTSTQSNRTASGVENTGATENKTVTFSHDGDPISSESIELQSGESRKVNFTYEITERDLVQTDLSVKIEDKRDSRTITVGPPEGEEFAAGRTSAGRITVALAESAVGPDGSISSGTDNVDIVSDPEHRRVWTLDLSDDPQNGMYYETWEVPQAEHIDDVSLVNASVKVENTDFSDEVDLHNVTSASFGAWAKEGKLYLPIETVGITDASETDISIKLPDSTVDGSFEDAHTVVVDLETFRDQTDPKDMTLIRFETNRSPVGPATDIEPEIRYLDGEIVLWHPHIETGEHMVTIHGIDGEGNETSANVTSDRSGVIPLPNGDQLAGADTVNISVTGVIDTQEAEGPRARSQSLEATLTDRGTIQTNRNLESLSISAVLVDTVYVSSADDNLSINNSELQISDVSLDDNSDVKLATDAGIVDVELSSAEGGASTGGSSILWLVMRLVAIVLVMGITIVGGFLTGNRFGINDRIERVILAVVVIVFSAIVLMAWLDVSLFESFSLPFEPWGQIGMGAVAIFGFGYAIGALSGANETDKRGHTQPSPTRIDVRVTDGTAPIKEEVKIQATSGHKSGREQSIRGPRGKLKLPKEDKRWRVTATLETENRTYTSDPVSVNPRTVTPPVTLEIKQPTVSVRVQDGKHDFPIPDALVRVETDEEVGTKRTDEDGHVSFDPPPQTETITLTADHDKYEQATIKRQLSESGFSETLQLQHLPGQLKIQSQIDGVATGQMGIEIAPDEPTLKKLYKEGVTIEETTDKNGISTKNQLLVGQYRIGLALPDGFEHLFETTEERIHVDQMGESVTLEASFTWNLSKSQRDRIAQIRGKLQDATTKSGVDIVIPQYYVSVVETVLEAVESFPEWGHHFVEIDADPDAVTDATLDSAAQAAETIAEAMSTKRNLDLFTACSDMPDTNIQWTGNFDMELLVDRLGEGPMVARRAFAARADEVSKRIESDRGSVSEIAPAREMLERIDIDESGEEVRDVVSIHVSILLLDAIAELFDHQELRERLSRTVF